MTSSDQVLRAAIIGTGRIGNSYDDEVTLRQPPSYFQGDNRHIGLYTVFPVNHADAYLTTPGYELVAAANRSQAKLIAFGERRNITALYTDFHHLLRSEQPDVVSICTQSPEKAEITIAAAESGVKAVIVEKAMSTSMVEADAMIEACERNNVLLVVNHPYRFSPPVRKIKQLVDEGAIGELTSITAHATGGMLHVGTHIFDLMCYWLGNAVEVFAQIPDYVAGQDLPAVGMVRFANDTIGFFDHIHRDQQSLELRGKLGYITVSPLIGDGWLYQFASTQPSGVEHRYPQRLIQQPIVCEPHTSSPTQRLLMELHETMRSNGTFVSTGHDGAAALELGVACHASHRAGVPMKLPLAERGQRVLNR